MNLMKAFNNISPFLILCIIAILWSSFNIILIYTSKREEVVALPLLFILLIAGIGLLFIDRWAVGRWDYKTVVWIELILIPVFIFVVSFMNKKITLQPAEGIHSFGIVYSVENEIATPTKYSSPFNQIINVDSENQIIYFNKKMKENYGLKISTECDYYINEERSTIAGKTYSIQVYSLCQELQEKDKIFEEIIEKIKNKNEPN